MNKKNIALPPILSHRDGSLVGEREPPGDEVLLVGPVLVLDREHTRLELGDDGDVVGRDLVLAHGSRDDDRRDGRSVVEGLLGEVEVEGHAGPRGGGEVAADGRGGGGGGAAEVGEHG